MFVPYPSFQVFQLWLALSEQKMEKKTRMGHIRIEIDRYIDATTEKYKHWLGWEHQIILGLLLLNVTQHIH